ncbi:unnamed protein product [Urochloa humidicola]
MRSLIALVNQSVTPQRQSRGSALPPTRLILFPSFFPDPISTLRSPPGRAPSLPRITGFPIPSRSRATQRTPSRAPLPPPLIPPRDACSMDAATYRLWVQKAVVTTAHLGGGRRRQLMGSRRGGHSHRRRPLRRASRTRVTGGRRNRGATGLACVSVSERGKGLWYASVPGATPSTNELALQQQLRNITDTKLGAPPGGLN